jgi:hypothetical protein
MAAPMTPQPGSRWRARPRGNHQGWRVRVRKVSARAVAFVRLGGHREPSQKKLNWMLVDAFLNGFTLERTA